MGTKVAPKHVPRAAQKHPCLILCIAGVSIVLLSCLLTFVIPWMVYDFTKGSHSEVVRLHGNDFRDIIDKHLYQDWKQWPSQCNDPSACPAMQVQEVLAIEEFTEVCSIVYVKEKIPLDGATFVAWTRYKFRKTNDSWVIVGEFGKWDTIPQCP